MINSSQNSRNAFSDRLKHSLISQNIAISPTVLAKGFNAQFNGDPISIQTASNWLHAVSFPNQDKLQVLAKWLCVDSHWLRFGESDIPNLKTLSPEQDELLRKFSRLSPNKQRLVLELIDALC